MNNQEKSYNKYIQTIDECICTRAVVLSGKMNARNKIVDPYVRLILPMCVHVHTETVCAVFFETPVKVHWLKAPNMTSFESLDLKI